MFRAATGDDADALVALVNSAFRGESSKAGWTTEADLLGGQRVDVDGIKQTIATPGNVILVVEENRALIACVLLQKTDDACYLGLLTVSPTLQNHGIGRRMLEWSEQWARDQWACRLMHMTVIVQRQELFDWYARRGYRRTGKRKPFPYGDERFGLPRRADLEFEVLEKDLRPPTNL